jgi:hypothetical protein
MFAGTPSVPLRYVLNLHCLCYMPLCAVLDCGQHLQSEEVLEIADLALTPVLCWFCKPRQYTWLPAEPSLCVSLSLLATRFSSVFDEGHLPLSTTTLTSELQLSAFERP